MRTRSATKRLFDDVVDDEEVPLVQQHSRQRPSDDNDEPPEPPRETSARAWSVALAHILTHIDDDEEALALIDSLPAVVRVHFGRQLRIQSAIVRANPRFITRYVCGLNRINSGVSPVTISFSHGGKDGLVISAASRVGQSFVAHRCARRRSAQINVSWYSITDAERDAIASVDCVDSLQLQSTDVARIDWNDGWNLKKFSAIKCQLRTIPEPLRRMRALWMLDVSSNCIAELPDDAAYYTSLVALNVSANRLTALPAALHQAQDLMRLAASRNHLRPETLPLMPASLRELDVTGNAGITRLEDVLESVWECSERMLIAVAPHQARCLCCDESSAAQMDACPASSDTE